MTGDAFWEVELYAYVGEDEFGSGEVGLKQADVPAGRIPLVAIDREKLDQEDVRVQLQAQANVYRKPIRLVRLRYVETVLLIEPQ